MLGGVYLALFVASFLHAIIATILFSRVTAKHISQKTEACGHFYMCIGDKFGYTLRSMALALIRPRQYAYRLLPVAFLDVGMVKEFLKTREINFWHTFILHSPHFSWAH